MAEDSKIEWTDHTFNPWVGCTKVSPGCDHCYAEGWAKRAGSVTWGAERQRTSIANWRKPLQWQKRAAEFMATHGRRQRVFCASLADVFDNEVPTLWRVELLARIGACENLDFLLLTKRIGNVKRLLCDATELAYERGMRATANWITAWVDGEPPPNVWLGATIVNQAEADRDIIKLMDTRAAKRFLSIEPLLGPITLERWLEPMGLDTDLGLMNPGIDWVIVGGESGPKARPMHPDWVRSLRDQCNAAGVAFHFKQWGEWAPGDDIDAHGMCRHNYWEQDRDDGGAPRHEWPVSEGPDFPCMRAEVYRVGKKAAGRLLDGIEHNGFPQAV